MTKLTQIENALLAINEAKFQALCDHYLYREGYQRINRIGSHVSKEKTTRGTPDTLLPLPNGRYVFVESTTQEKGLFGKLSADVDKCFDESSTGVPVDKIEKIILCHNSKLSAAEQEALTVKCQQQGCLLDIIGLDSLSFGLLEKHQPLTVEYLEIELDTGQILSPSDFIRRYQKSAFATPLDLKFHFRGEELKAACDALETNDLLIITGPAGVGKTRLALECVSKFIERHSSYQPFCVFSKSLPLYQDLKTYFSNDGEYLIFADDANHVSELDLLLNLLHEQREGHHTKIIVTVRDYALAKIRKTAREYSARTELHLESFKSEEISEILETEFGIRNRVYLERICKIAKGNPRLAVMAASLAKQTNKLESISDASGLYDEYFSSIVEDISELQTGKLLKLGGILAFFGSLDRTTEGFKEIAKNFGFSESEFWEGLQQLHAAELVDRYENEVVKISDQVLGTYLFYRAFFKIESADFSVLLSSYFGKYEYKFREAVYPVLDIFDHKFVSERLKKHVDAAWDKGNGDEAKLIPLMRVFWFLKKEEILIYFKDRIDSLPTADADFATLTFQPESQGLLKDQYLDVLEAFQHAAGKDFRIAFELILTYLEKQPALLPEVLYLLLERFCFEPESYDHGYITQRAVVDILIDKSTEPTTGLLHQRLLLRIAEKYLKTQFRSHRLEGLKIVIQEFGLSPTPELLELRKSLWEFVARSCSEPQTRDLALQLMLDHATRFHDTPVNGPTNKIVTADSHVLLPFLSSTLKPSSYEESVVMQQYLRFLKQHKVVFDRTLPKRYANETYVISKVLLPEWDIHFQERRTKEIKKLVGDYTYRDYVRFLEVCREIQKNIAQDVKAYQLMSAIDLALMDLADRDSALFKKVVKHILQTGNQLGYVYQSVIWKLRASYSSPRHAYSLLKRHEYTSKPSWLFAFLSQLQPTEVNQFYLSELYSLYRTADLGMLANLDVLEVYRAIDPNVVVNVVRILFDRSGPDQTANFHYLFNPNSYVFQNLKTLFRDNVELLEDVYFHQSAVDSLVNYRGAVLKLLVELDPDFLTKYLEWLYGNQNYVSEPMDGARYVALWTLDDYETIITTAVEFVFEKEKSAYLRYYNYLNAFFRHERDGFGSELKPTVSERMEAFISNYIDRHHSDRERMRFIFGVIRECFPGKRVRFLELFLSFNQDSETFEGLGIQSRSFGGTGSMVPVFEKKIEFLESVLPLLSTSALLKHKRHVNNLIMEWRQEIETENKKNFLGF